VEFGDGSGEFLGSRLVLRSKPLLFFASHVGIISDEMFTRLAPKLEESTFSDDS
jgi:hypothetical protein